MTDEQKEARRPYQRACSRVWNAAQEHGVPLHLATGFFTATDWKELAEERITLEALDTVMGTIASDVGLRQLLSDERSGESHGS
jgi:hypothetical protein